MKTEVAKLVTFRLGGDLFAADIFDVERVLRYQEPTPLPDVPEWIEGMIEYQTQVVPVINLRKRFELPTLPPTNETRILVLTFNEEWIGLVVDAVVEVSLVDPGQLSLPPAFFRGLSAEYLKGIVRPVAPTGEESGAVSGGSERLVIVLDVEHLLSATDRIALEAAGEGAPGTGAGGGAKADA